MGNPQILHAVLGLELVIAPDSSIASAASMPSGASKAPAPRTWPGARHVPGRYRLRQQRTALDDDSAAASPGTGSDTASPGPSASAAARQRLVARPGIKRHGIERSGPRPADRRPAGHVLAHDEAARILPYIAAMLHDAYGRAAYREDGNANATTGTRPPPGTPPAWPASAYGSFQVHHSQEVPSAGCISLRAASVRLPDNDG